MGVNHRFAVRVRAPLQEVWNALTRTDGVQPFYFNSVLETDLRPGSRMRYLSPDREHVFIEGEVVEVESPHRFVHEFSFSDLKDEKTRVTFLLSGGENETEFAIVHEGFSGETKTYKRSAKGWPLIQKNLKSYLERGKLPFKSRVQHGVMKLFLPLMPRAK